MTEKRKEYQKKYYEANKERYKEYNKKYYEANKEGRKESGNKYREDNREKLRKRSELYREINKDKIKEQSIGLWIKRKYEGIPCMDCEGVFPFYVMDFDHRPEEVKEFKISDNAIHRATSERIAKWMKEIDKCDLVCSNCHRERTFDRSIV